MEPLTNPTQTQPLAPTLTLTQTLTISQILTLNPYPNPPYIVENRAEYFSVGNL